MMMLEDSEVRVGQFGAFPRTLSIIIPSSNLSDATIQASSFRSVDSSA